MTRTSRRPRGTDRAPAGRRPAPSRPQVESLAAAVARAWLEIEAGRRPLAQLTPLLSPAVASRLRQRLTNSGRVLAPPVQAVRSLRPSWSSPTACDVAVIVQRAARVGALAIRLEVHRGSWRVVELVAPEWGQRPLPTGSTPTSRPRRDAFDDVLSAE